MERAVHLVRNPFINLIARFIREREHDRRKDKKFQEEYPMLPKKGFQKWCGMLDDKFTKIEDEVFGDDDKTLRLMRSSICHAEVYKYVQWHNYAFATTAALDVPTIVVYYEDFQSKFRETNKKILDFVELPSIVPSYSFPVYHNYTRFFSEQDRADIRALAKRIATKETWQHIEHYFFRNATI